MFETKNRCTQKKMNSRRASRKNRRNTRSRASRRQNAGGYQMSQQWFNPEVLPPSTIFPAPSTAPNAYEIRPVLSSTFKASGGSRRSLRKGRATRGGFSPSIMGPFVANAQAAIVPLALYGLYHKFVPKRSSGGRTRKASRK